MILISELSFMTEPKARRASGYNRVRYRPWEFYQKHVIPNVNVIASDVDSGNHEWRPYAEEAHQ